MILLVSKTHDPSFNLATEEYLMNQFDEDIFYLYRNAPSIIIGKNQNAHKEINKTYCLENNIPVVRRMSGGGAVFHDLGNQNFCFITKRSGPQALDFRTFTEPVLQLLNKIGVDAQFTGRNDLTIDGKKFSGNAQYLTKDKVLHHGTLLFSSNINDLSQALNVKKEKYESKGIKSVASRVTNITSHLYRDMSIEEFTNLLIRQVKDTYKIESNYTLDKMNIEGINCLVQKKYGNDEWTFGKINDYKINHQFSYEKGHIDLHMNVEEGVIKDIKFYGDYFSVENTEDIENLLIGISHSPDAIKKQLTQTCISDYFTGLTLDELIKEMF